MNQEKKKVKFSLIKFTKKGSYRFVGYGESDDENKKNQELRPLLNVNDFFKKIIIMKDDIVPFRNDEGILIIGIKQFLLNENSLEN